jgi:DNA repair exonuclease SbcCD ATPase subunit
MSYGYTTYQPAYTQPMEYSGYSGYTTGTAFVAPPYTTPTVAHGVSYPTTYEYTTGPVITGQTYPVITGQTYPTTTYEYTTPTVAVTPTPAVAMTETNKCDALIADNVNRQQIHYNDIISQLEENYKIQIKELNVRIQLLNQNSSQSEGLSRANQTLQSELQTLKSSREEEIRGIIDKQKALCTTITDRISNEKQALEHAQALCNEKTQNLERNIGTITEELSSLNAKITRHEQKISQIEKEKQTLLLTINKANKEKSEAETSLNQLQSELNTLREQNGMNIDKKIREQNKILEQKEVDLDTQQKKIASIEKQVTEK